MKSDRMWKEAVVIYLRVPSRHMPGGGLRSIINRYVGRACLRGEI
jgi:hypothetical protein